MSLQHRANVWVRQEHCGRLLDDGSTLILETLPGPLRDGGRYAFGIPFRPKYEWAHLHPYFSNLLPEGRRLTALRARAKVSAEDELGMLVQVGQDLVGDTAITLPDETLQGRPPRKHRKLADVSFRDFFEESLGFGPNTGRAAIPGVQDKISESMISFPVRGEGYILKLNTEQYPDLVENEAHYLGLARRCGFEVSEFRIVHDRDGVSGLLVKRFDRVQDKESKEVKKLHVEDMCQLLGVYQRSKYDVTLRQVLEAILALTGNRAVVLETLRQVAFSYLICNGDQHAKNLSVIERASGLVTMSPVYDVLATWFHDDRRTALELEGKDSNWKSRDFVAAAGRMGIPEAAMRMTLRTLCRRVGDRMSWPESLPFDAKQRDFLKRTMDQRLEDLGT